MLGGSNGHSLSEERLPPRSHCFNQNAPNGGFVIQAFWNKPTNMSLRIPLASLSGRSQAA